MQSAEGTHGAIVALTYLCSKQTFSGILSDAAAATQTSSMFFTDEGLTIVSVWPYGCFLG